MPEENTFTVKYVSSTPNLDPPTPAEQEFAEQQAAAARDFYKIDESVAVTVERDGITIFE